MSIAVLRNNGTRGSVNKRTDAALAESWIHAIASRNAGEDDIFDERLERSGQTCNVSFTVGGK
jgi:hypothetical protein